MLIIKELTNQISWMANLTDVNQNVYFSHCTIPTKLTKKYNILTHFETDEGTAVEGDFTALNKLKTSPLGNHHIIIPKNHYNILKMFLEYFNFTII